MLAGTLVAVVVSGSELVGPAVTGIAMIFPVTLLAIGWIMHRHYGGFAAVAVLGSALVALPGFAACTLTLHLLAGPIEAASAMLAALGVSILALVPIMLGSRDRVLHVI